MVMRLLFIILLIACFFSSYAQNLRSGGALKPEQAIMDIRHYTVALEVDPQTKSIKGYTEIDLILSSTSPVLLLDLWHGMKVALVTVNGKKATFNHTENDLLTITGAKPFAAGKIKI